MPLRTASLMRHTAGTQADRERRLRISDDSFMNVVNRRKADTWTKTNVVTHIDHVLLNERLAETRILKLWRNQKKLDFPSFYLELALIDALPRQNSETLSGNVWRALQYLGERFPIARIVDPANTNNIISDDLSLAEKMKIAQAARQALNAKKWGEIVG